MSVKNFDKIKTLLQTRQQRYSRLIDGNGCLCIEGVFFIAWGGTGQLDRNGEHCIKLKSKVRSHYLEAADYKDSGIPHMVPKSLISELELTEWQQARLDTLSGFKPLSWPTLNDGVQLDFLQFERLLELIDQLPTTTNQDPTFQTIVEHNWANK